MFVKERHFITGQANMRWSKDKSTSVQRGYSMEENNCEK